MKFNSKHGPCLEMPGSPKMRSAWERNYYRYALRFYQHVQYEPHRYRFPKPYRRSLDYLPDFTFDDQGVTYIAEVKGYMDSKSRAKLLGFKKYYPDEAARLVIITNPAARMESGLKVGLWVYKNLSPATIIDYGLLKKEFGSACGFE